MTTCSVDQHTKSFVMDHPIIIYRAFNIIQVYQHFTIYTQYFLLKFEQFWFSPGTLVSSTNKTDRHDITEILLIVVLNTINQTKPTYPTLKLVPKTILGRQK
jgi:hypothetical protein